MQERKRFSDFAVNEGGALAGEKVKMADILGEEIYLTGYRVMTSRAVHGKNCLQLQFEMPGDDGEGKKYVAFTNSEVLIRQCTDYEAELPFLVTITKVNSYYTFN